MTVVDPQPERSAFALVPYKGSSQGNTDNGHPLRKTNWCAPTEEKLYKPKGCAGT